MFSQAILLSAVAVVINCQVFDDPSLAKILSDRRKQTISGDFGVSFQQEDGTDFNEVADTDGYRVGQYSYIDSFGEKKTVKYEAGPEIGFRIISADNIPRPVQLPAQHQQIHQQRAQQQLQRAQQQPKPQPQQFRPQPQQFQPQPQQFQPQPQQFGPPQPFSFTVETGAQAGGRPQQRRPAPQQFRRPQPAPQPRPSPSAFPQTVETDAVPPTFFPRTTTTTSAPRFFPPGQLSLTRNEQGYVYSFSS